MALQTSMFPKQQEIKERDIYYAVCTKALYQDQLAVAVGKRTDGVWPL
jgi:hypothetical protein